MPKIEKYNKKIRPSDNIAIFHDTREDVKLLSQVLNGMIDKLNEVIDAVNALEGENK